MPAETPAPLPEREQLAHDLWYGVMRRVPVPSADQLAEAVLALGYRRAAPRVERDTFCRDCGTDLRPLADVNGVHSCHTAPRVERDWRTDAEVRKHG